MSAKRGGMMVDELNKRKKRVLKAIIQEHVFTAEPIGSRTIARNYKLGVSAATIRNEMSDLEEMGFLKQPHTSAGRVPSDKGYRYYVDILMEQKIDISDKIKENLNEFSDERESIQEIMSGMVKMLSSLTRYTALISEPYLEESKVRKIQLIKMARNRLLILVITDTGIVNNKTINLNQDLTTRQLRYLNEFLAKKLKGMELSEINTNFLQKLELELLARLNISEELLQLLNNKLSNLSESGDLQIYLGGTSYILEQPEFNDMDILKKVLNTLDRKDILKKLISDLSGDGIDVKIGHENRLREMQNCSIVVATYHFNERALGKIGVIGPTRMEYSRVISTVDFVSDVLGKLILKASR